MTRLQASSCVRRHLPEFGGGEVLARLVVAVSVGLLLWPIVAGMVGR